jgi:hypothetical protein
MSETPESQYTSRYNVQSSLSVIVIPEEVLSILIPVPAVVPSEQIRVMFTQFSLIFNIQKACS